jgi:putative transcriptional regulator
VTFDNCRTRDWPAELRALRARLGLSQAGLAGHLGISKRTLQEWEQGRRTPRGLAAAFLERELRAG